MSSRHASPVRRSIPLSFCLLLTNSQSIIGDLVLIHGSVLHKSSKNQSPHTRFAYTFHMIESPPHAEYDAKNWLQPTPALPFSRILDSPNASVHPASGRV